MTAQVFDSNGNLVSSVVVKKYKIVIFLPSSKQVNDLSGQLDFNFKCVQKIADAINDLEPKPERIRVKQSNVDDLEAALTVGFGELSDINLVMWGDHSADRDSAGLCARGEPDKWIYVCKTDRGRYLAKGPKPNPFVDASPGNTIKLKDDIKLINYGCNGNTDSNKKLFEDAFKDVFADKQQKRYEGKYDTESTDKVVTLDIIYELLTIWRDYAQKLKNVFKQTLSDIENRYANKYFEIKGTGLPKETNKKLSERLKNTHKKINDILEQTP
ncbi:MAG: hypothetical protein LBH93_06460 [Chitinispirillales bacterium]|jgi:hypothetical protein|nr:hypothetical protein [Chitinispirillales bacterium]